MANNKLYLVHKPTGRRVHLGDYFPSTGWSLDVGDICAKELFANLSECLGSCECSSLHGGNEFELDYDLTDADISNELSGRGREKLNALNGFRVASTRG